MRPNGTALLLTLGAAVATGIALDSAARAAPRAWQSAVERVDGELAAAWTAGAIEPAPPASDAEFLRRVTLDLVGRIPTAGEAKAFLADRSPRRRERLVDRLLASTDYADYWADVYLDLLVGRDLRMRPRLSAHARDYLRAAFTASTPFDRMAEQIVTASGPLDENGATAFLVAQQRKGGSIEAVAGETARIFLGLQVQCARCHDHPYDQRYKKQSFADFTAFYGDVRIRRDRQGKGPGALTIEDRPLPPGIAERPRFQERLEKRPDLAYALAEPRYFFRSVEPRAGESKRQRLARAIRSSDLLAKAAVNRLWAQLLGRPIAGDSWDDLGAEGDDSHPALLRTLASDFAASGYDHRRLLKVIALSSAYGRSSRAPDAAQSAPPPAPDAAQSAPPRGPDAAQSAPPPAPDAARSAPRAPDAPGSAPRAPDASATEPPVRARDEAVLAAEQAFARAAVRPLSADQLYRSLLVASGLPLADSSPPTRVAAGDAPTIGVRGKRRRRMALREFLFTFADDETREGDAFTGSVSQALLLLNGAVANQGTRSRPDRALGRMLAASPELGQRIEWMFLAALARAPTATERERYARYIEKRGGARGAYEDLYHALVTSTEFTTNH